MAQWKEILCDHCHTKHCVALGSFYRCGWPFLWDNHYIAVNKSGRSFQTSDKKEARNFANSD